MTRLAYLFQRYFEKTATPQESEEFLHLSGKNENADELRRLMEQAWTETEKPQGQQQSSPPPFFTVDQSSEMWSNVLGNIRPDIASLPVRNEAAPEEPVNVQKERSVHRLFWLRTAAAAVVVVAVAGGWWWKSSTPKPAPDLVQASPKIKDIAPGGNKAILILNNGSSITLDSARTGMLATQGNVQVVQQKSGQLAYKNNASADNMAPLSFNIVRTPKGGQYQVALPDGSKVWLNAATSLRFPTAFTGKERTVELNGEAYFEIAANKNQPFRVRVNNMTVEVLGTQFNVMAYDDEASVNTCLTQGAVRVNNGNESRLLQPGQEARIGLSKGDWRVEAVDTDQVVAWKNGLFHFEGADLRTVMRQIGRWYDVDVKYEGEASSHYSGLISRSVGLTKMLHMLELAGKNRFSVDGTAVLVKAR